MNDAEDVDSTKEKTHTAIYVDTLDEIHAEKSRVKRTQGLKKKPSAADIIEMAWESYKQAQADKAKRGEVHESDPQRDAYVAAFLEAIKIDRNWIQMKPILEPFLGTSKATQKTKSNPGKIKAS